MAAALISVCLAVDSAAVPGLFTDPLKSGGRGPETVLIDIGRMRMGRLPGEAVCGEPRPTNEPAHPVVFGEPFAMSRDVITVGEFRRFVEDTGYMTHAERSGGWRSLAGRRGRIPDGTCAHSSFSGHAPTRAEIGAHWLEPGYAQTDAHPAVRVNHDDAVAYADWLARETELPYSLASEAQWEYVARSFRSDAQLRHQAIGWRDELGAILRTHGRLPAAAPVDTGVQNSHGIRGIGVPPENGSRPVAEWTADCWNDNYRNAPANGAAWVTGDCRKAVVRHVAFDLVTCRVGRSRSISTTAMAFRVVRTVNGGLPLE